MITQQADIQALTQVITAMIRAFNNNNNWQNLNQTVANLQQAITNNNTSLNN